MSNVAVLPTLVDDSVSLSKTKTEGTHPDTGNDELATTSKNEQTLSEDNGDNKTETSEEANGEGRLIRGRVIVRDGINVARYVVSVQDDGDPSLTFRSFIIGSALTALSACIDQIYYYKPVNVSFDAIFLVIIAYVLGYLWSVILPTKAVVERYFRGRASWLAAIAHCLNPGKFGLKEHATTVILASLSDTGSATVQVFAVEKYYNRSASAGTIVLCLLSTSLLGMGLVGLLRSILIHPSEMVYWRSLPTVSIFQTFHKSHEGVNHRRIQLFGGTALGMAIWEPFASYIWPWLNGISVFCLATMNAPNKSRTIIKNIFGGSNANEGQGILSISLDWQYITSRYLALPLIAQANAWIGLFLSYLFCLALYYGNAWGAKNYPFMSTSLFDPTTHRVYNQTRVFDRNVKLDVQALERYGTPRLTATNIWYNIVTMAALSALIVHLCLFHGTKFKRSITQAMRNTETDPHYIAMRDRYSMVPVWWYVAAIVVGFFLGLGAVLKGETSFHWWSYIVAIAFGTIITPFSIALYGLLGSLVTTNNVVKMLSAALQPGRPLANLYFTIFSHETIGVSTNIADALKLAQYLKIPFRTMFILQTYGICLSSALNYVIMETIISNKRDVLLDPRGTQAWSGQKVQALNSNAVTWSLAKYVYRFDNGGYGIIPLSLVFGAVIPLIHWLMHKRVKSIRGFKLDQFITPVILMNAASTYTGSNSVRTTQILTGLWSQWFMRLRHPRWFGRYNYILGAGLDAGAKIMMFILTFAVFGASGKERPFPNWWGNPATSTDRYSDYCGGGS